MLLHYDYTTHRGFSAARMGARAPMLRCSDGIATRSLRNANFQPIILNARFAPVLSPIFGIIAVAFFNQANGVMYLYYLGVSRAPISTLTEAGTLIAAPG